MLSSSEKTLTHCVAAVTKTNSVLGSLEKGSRIRLLSSIPRGGEVGRYVLQGKPLFSLSLVASPRGESNTSALHIGCVGEGEAFYMAR